MSGEDSPEERRIKALIEELREVAGRLVPRVFGVEAQYPRKAQEPLEIPILGGVIEKAFPDEWRQSHVNALELTLRVAIRRLEGKFPPGDPQWKPNRLITNQEVALHYFNLDGAPELPSVKAIDTSDDIKYKGVGAKGYNKVLYELKKQVGFDGGTSTFARFLTALRHLLAKVLLDPAFPSTSTSTPAPTSGVVAVRSTLSDEYVPRPEYEQRIRQLRDAGERHVWLWGDAGTGKSRLAQAANRDLVAERSVKILPCADEQVLHKKLGDLLVEVGVSGSEINPLTLWALFNRQLGVGGLPKVIVIEDLTDLGQIQRLTEMNHDSFLVFTSIARPPERYSGDIIEVLSMDEAESEQMIRSRLPGIGDGNVVMLNAVLAGRPLAIEHSCAFLRRTGMPVREFCQELSREPAATLDKAGKRFGRTLTQVYGLVLDQLASSPEAIRALDLLVFSTDLMTLPLLAEIWVDGLELPAAMPEVDTELDQDYIRSASLWCGAWTGVKFIDPTRLPKINPLDSVDLHEAVLQLEDSGLVRSDGARLVMHQLTRAILRSLRDEQADNIYQRIRRTVYDTVVAENWKGGDALSATRLWWAPQLREALSRALRAVPNPDQVSADEATRLATLAAVMLRAHRQVGIDPRIVLDDAIRALVVASFHHRTLAESDPDRDALLTAHRSLHIEVLEFLVLLSGFDRGVDSFPNFGQPPAPHQWWLANTIRLTQATEWDLAHHYLGSDERQAREHNTIGWRLGATGDHPTLQGVRNSAEDAITMATLYYDQARWKEAIDALEHAYGCYLQIGASVEAIYGAIDAGRRLARVHLRTGHLHDAAAWLDRIAREVYQQRSECTFNGNPSPFKLIDRLLEAQVQQARAELEMTALVLEFDKPDTEITPEIIATVLQPRHERAKQAVELVHALRANRLVPEFSMHALRLQILTNSLEGIDALRPQFDHDKEPYRAALSQLQVHTLVTPFMATMLMLSEAEFDTYRQTVPVEQAEFAGQIRAARDQMGNQLVELAQEVGVTHGNPYWHVRGVCAAAILATAANADPAWAASLRDTAKGGARNIGRPDWAEKVDGFGNTNEGLWLIGY